MSKRHKPQRLESIMKIGYVRVSKQEQNEALQRDALKEAHCEKYFSDKMTGPKFERKGLEELLAFMRSGDTVVVWKLDRINAKSSSSPLRSNFAPVILSLKYFSQCASFKASLCNASFCSCLETRT